MWEFNRFFWKDNFGRDHLNYENRNAKSERLVHLTFSLYTFLVQCRPHLGLPFSYAFDTLLLEVYVRPEIDVLIDGYTIKPWWESLNQRIRLFTEFAKCFRITNNVSLFVEMKLKQIRLKSIGK